MENAITPILLGIVLCVLGINNMQGNISSLHRYHRKRVSEEDRKPFGKLVGLGTLIIGVAMVIFGVITYIYEITQIALLLIAGSALLIIAIIAGLILSFYAMIKYNKGIF